MKKIFIFLAASSLLYACNSNDAQGSNSNYDDSVKHARMLEAASDSTNYTTIQWLDSTNQQLGKVQEGQTVEISWKFKNTGTKPLIITNASASCGCTVAERPQEPVAPGAEGVIKAKFDSNGREGAQHKDVYVEANTKENRSHRLSFALEVQKK